MRKSKKNNPCNIFMLKIQKDEKSGSIDPVFLVKLFFPANPYNFLYLKPQNY